MGETSIEWTEQTWNPVRGCKMVSPGCANCYAMRMAGRLSGKRQPYHGLVQLGSKGKGFRWTGDFREVPELLDVPLRRRKPTTFFVNSMSDLFGEGVSDEYIAAVFGVMAACPQHTFQVLTKRAERVVSWFDWVAKRMVDGRRVFPFDSDSWLVQQFLRSEASKRKVNDLPQNHGGPWPLPNVWVGVSVESQAYADERIPHLLRTPAAVRFLSCEPLLGPVDIACYLPPHGAKLHQDSRGPYVDWVIVGGESGPMARPMHPDWVRSIRDQCQAAGVPFFFKQWGEHAPMDARALGGRVIWQRLGKKASGRILDGRTWDEMPEVRR